MKAYISGSLEDEKEVIKLANMLKYIGFEITREWWNHKNMNLKSLYACEDLIAIQKCDLFIIYNSDIKTSGKFIELGIAIGLNKPIISMGKELTSPFKIFAPYLTDEKELLQMERCPVSRLTAHRSLPAGSDNSTLE